MVVPRSDKISFKNNKPILTDQIEPICALMIFQMAAFDENAFTPELSQVSGCSYQILSVSDLPVQQNGSLRQIGGHHIGHRHQVRF